jgi:hypothetical protein
MEENKVTRVLNLNYVIQIDKVSKKLSSDFNFKTRKAENERGYVKIIKEYGNYKDGNYYDKNEVENLFDKKYIIDSEDETKIYEKPYIKLIFEDQIQIIYFKENSDMEEWYKNRIKNKIEYKDFLEIDEITDYKDGE